MSSKKNPHIHMASDEQLVTLLEGRTAELRQTYVDTHRLLLETLPGVVHSTDCTDGVTGYGARQYGYDGWGVAALAAHTRWVSLMFFRGTDLDDPNKLLEGSGKKMRHVKIHSLEQLNEQRDSLRTFIKEAAGLNVQ